MNCKSKSHFDAPSTKVFKCISKAKIENGGKMQSTHIASARLNWMLPSLGTRSSECFSAIFAQIRAIFRDCSVRRFFCGHCVQRAW